MNLSKKTIWFLISIFTVIEAIFLVLIFNLQGMDTKVVSFMSIALAFLFSLLFLNFKNKNFFIQAGLVFTVCADVFLILCNPREQTLGMVFFSIAQIVYCCKLFFEMPNKKVRLANIISRIVAVVLAQCLAFLVLGSKIDFLVIVSMFYYTNLCLNVVFAFVNFKKNPYFALGMILFLLCDTIIGFKVAVGTYISIPESSFFYQLATSSFSWEWLFYLPSQTLIALSAFQKCNCFIQNTEK